VVAAVAGIVANITPQMAQHPRNHVQNDFIPSEQCLAAGRKSKRPRKIILDAETFDFIRLCVNFNTNKLCFELLKYDESTIA
jgi:hypothetical protein